MQTEQYNRQKLYYKWALILCIIAISGYSIYFLYERYINDIDLFSQNKSLLLRSAITIYFILLFVFTGKFPKKIFRLLGFLIVVPLSWTISLISFLTVGYEGITVTGFIFLILSSAIVFDFSMLYYSVALLLMLVFHFTLLSFYPVYQPDGLMNHAFLLGLATILGIVTNYLINVIKNNETKALKERELLLKEIHHRVKNNLQIIISLLNLQSGSINDGLTKTAVRESQDRVKSMALIHQLLYQSETSTSIDFCVYLEQLMLSLQDTYRKPDKYIRFNIKAESIKLDIDTAIPLGLITNELATNAYKYAFKARPDGEIMINFFKDVNDTVTLKVKDNGSGLPKDFNLENIKSMGLKLVNLLSRQIRAKIVFTVHHGTEFLLVFNVNR